MLVFNFWVFSLMPRVPKQTPKKSFSLETRWTFGPHSLYVIYCIYNLLCWIIITYAPAVSWPVLATFFFSNVLACNIIKLNKVILYLLYIFMYCALPPIDIPVQMSTQNLGFSFYFLCTPSKTLKKKKKKKK